MFSSICCFLAISQKFVIVPTVEYKYWKTVRKPIYGTSTIKVRVGTVLVLYFLRYGTASVNRQIR
jgi:hypothetical protein